jgi:6-pyruvoyltetrahydropterin/6-carboxytetrahydropterin synthase
MRIEVSGPGFSAAHFIVGHKRCEHLHGHNWGVKLVLEGTLGRGEMVADFNLLKGLLGRLCKGLDHRILIPAENPGLRLSKRGESLLLRVHGKRFEFPAGDVALLPLRNTTVEELAGHLLSALAKVLGKRPNISKIALWVEELPGQGAWAELER